MRSLRWLALTLALILLGAGLAPGASAQSPPANLSRLIVVGDSLSAGFQNGSLHEDLQVNGYANLIAGQAGVALPLPLIAAPGIPNVLTLVDPGPPPVIVRAGGISTGRVDPFVQPFNLAVPGARVGDALEARPDFLFDDLTDLVLGLPGLLAGTARSQVEWAEALEPTTILVWIGNMDALGAAIEGDASLLTPVPAFEASYGELMTRLAATGATLVVGNIPDVTAIAFLIAAEDVAALVGLPLAVIGPALGVGPGDFVLPDAVPLIGPILAGQAAGPLPANLILDAGEAAAIQQAVEAFNQVIETQAAAHGAAVVDVNALLERARAHGIVVGGQRLTTAFLGGLFSVDGIHPTNTGYAIVANEFIHTLNRRFEAGVPKVNVRDIQRADPLVLAADRVPATGDHVSAATARTLRRLFRH
jgi:hypothetical protein